MAQYIFLVLRHPFTLYLIHVVVELGIIKHTKIRFSTLFQRNVENQMSEKRSKIFFLNNPSHE